MVIDDPGKGLYMIPLHGYRWSW